jgi:excinuclease ABC subunit A
VNKALKSAKPSKPKASKASAAGLSPLIHVRGAREHNLQDITVELPRNQLVVITGLSGSGKSSLAFDTIYAEGQRRYVESLSAYARQFLELMQKPDVDSIDGLSPAISIEQKTTSRNPRSTVGTVTEIHDYMRLLWARIGVPYSPATGLPIEAQTVTQMVDRIMAMGDRTRLYLLAPIVRGRKGEYRKELADLQKKGFQRVKVDGTLYEIDDVPALNKKLKHDIDVVVDRVVVRDDLESRLADSLETALALTDGIAYAEDADKDGDDARTVFSAKFACPVSGFTIDEIEPRLFSFNNPFGACPSCDGLGVQMRFDPDLVVPNKTKTLAEGAVAPWSNASPPSPYYLQALKGVAKIHDANVDTPWKKLNKKTRDAILYGSGDQEILIKFGDGKRTFETRKPFEGVIKNLSRRWRETDSAWIREELGKYQTSQQCDSCNGHRLKAEALAVKVDGKHVSEISDLSILDAHVWFQGLEKKLSAKDTEIARRILREIDERLGFLNNVGLEYLTLARNSGTLSGASASPRKSAPV